MNKIFEKKLLLNKIYKKYLKRCSSNKTFLSLDGYNTFNRIFCNKIIKDGNYLILQHYFINIKSMNAHNMLISLYFKNSIKNYKYNKITQEKLKHNKFCDLKVIKSTIGGFVCIMKGIIIYCNNNIVKKYYSKNINTKPIFMISTLNYLYKIKIFKIILLLDNKLNLLKKRFKFSLFNKNKWKIIRKRRKKKRVKLALKKINNYFLYLKKLNIKDNNFKKFFYRFKQF